MSRDLPSELGVDVLDERYVVDGNRVTGGGVTAGIDFGLKLASLLRSETEAKQIQLQLQYNPRLGSMPRPPPLPAFCRTRPMPTALTLRQNAKGAARTTGGVRNCFALRFARVLQDAVGASIGCQPTALFEDPKPGGNVKMIGEHRAPYSGTHAIVGEMRRIGSSLKRIR